jgi:hypothetical protein
MTFEFTLTIFVIVMLLGFGYFVINLWEIIGKKVFIKEFRQKLIKYVNSGGEDFETYEWLISKSNKMQFELGATGIFAAYVIPLSGLSISNFHIILNLIPELRKALESQFRHSSKIISIFNQIEEALIRHNGTLDDKVSVARKAVLNPIKCFIQGFRIIWTSPIILLSWFGIISADNQQKITQGRIFNIFTSITAFIGFIGGIVGLIVDREEFLQIISQFLK